MTPAELLELERAQARLLADLARNAPPDIPIRRGKEPAIRPPLTDERLAALQERHRAHTSRVSHRLLRQLKAKTTNCYLCRQPIGSNFEIDHIIPISRGGTHTEDNLALTHASCNNTKAARIVAIDITTGKATYHR